MARETTHSLTGQQRYRLKQRLFRAPLLVLQIEVREYGYAYFSSGFGVESELIDRTYWRDATPIDCLSVPLAA